MEGLKLTLIAGNYKHEEDKKTGYSYSWIDPEYAQDQEITLTIPALKINPEATHELINGILKLVGNINQDIARKNEDEK